MIYAACSPSKIKLSKNYLENHSSRLPHIYKAISSRRHLHLNKQRTIVSESGRHLHIPSAAKTKQAKALTIFLIIRTSDNQPHDHNRGAEKSCLVMPLLMSPFSYPAALPSTLVQNASQKYIFARALVLALSLSALTYPPIHPVPIPSQQHSKPLIHTRHMSLPTSQPRLQTTSIVQPHLNADDSLHQRKTPQPYKPLAFPAAISSKKTNESIDTSGCKCKYQSARPNSEQIYPLQEIRSS